MKQFKRFGGDEAIGAYTEWDKNQINYCVYCGEHASTREHIPSKMFLDEPYPNSLPTVPACFKCNNGFSADEEYMGSYLEMLSRVVFQNYKSRTKTDKTLNHNNSLNNTLKKEIHYEEGKLNLIFQTDRFLRVLRKLAISHAAYEMDALKFDDEMEVTFKFLFQMSKDEIAEFNKAPIIDVIPEIGSRICNRVGIVTSEFGIVENFVEWILVQENRYRYCVCISDRVNIKMVINELFYVNVTW